MYPYDASGYAYVPPPVPSGRFGEWSWERAKQAAPFVILFPILFTLAFLAMILPPGLE